MYHRENASGDDGGIPEGTIVLSNWNGGSRNPELELPIECWICQKWFDPGEGHDDIVCSAACKKEADEFDKWELENPEEADALRNECLEDKESSKYDPDLDTWRQKRR